MTGQPNKREILQKILDDIEPGWSIRKPPAANPCDLECLCIFVKLEENSYKEARVDINNFLFQSRHLDRIKEFVLHAIRNAKTIQ